MHKGLLGERSQLLQRQLTALFDIMLRFRAFADRLHEAARVAANRVRAAALQAEQRAVAGQWGSSAADEAAAALAATNVAAEMRSQVGSGSRFGPGHVHTCMLAREYTLLIFVFGPALLIPSVVAFPLPPSAPPPPQLDAIAREYGVLLDGFLSLLQVQTHVDLRFLMFRLDFTFFYSQTMPRTPIR